MATTDKILTVKEVAERTGIGVSTINLYCRAGKFPNAKKVDSPIGEFWQIPEGDLQLVSKQPRGRPTKVLKILGGFDLRSAITKLNDPIKIMQAWFEHEGKVFPADFGILFFKGWETFTEEEKFAACTDAKSVVDRSLKDQ